MVIYSKKEKFDIPKLFGIFTIYHFYCFKMQLFENYAYITFLFLFLFVEYEINQMIDRR